MKTETKHTPLNEVAILREGQPIVRISKSLAIAAPDLLAVCNAICNELYAWRSSGDPRPSSWTESRIKRLNSVISKAEGR